MKCTQCETPALPDAETCSALCGRIASILSVSLPHWTDTPSNDRQLEQYFVDAPGSVLGAQNMAGGGGGGFDPRASDSRIVGKLVRRESAVSAFSEALDSDYKLVGKRLIGVRGERTGITRERETMALLANLTPQDRVVLFLAFGQACSVPAFSVRLRESAQVRATAEGGGKRGVARWLRVTVVCETPYERWEAAQMPRSMPEWLLTHQGALRDSLREADALVRVAHNRWRDLRGRRARVERHATAEEAQRALEEL